MDNKKHIPGGVKLISILHYVGGVFAIIFGILLMSLSKFATVTTEIPFFETLTTTVIIFIGVLIIVFGILGFFIGWGLWKGKKWSKNLVVIFSCVGMVYGIALLFTGGFAGGIIQILISGLIGGYLFFSENVKNAFA